MPSNWEYKGKGIKGRNYDEPGGVGTASAGITCTTGNLNDGGVGTPDDGDAGNRQSAGRGQPGGTPAPGRSQRGQARQDDSDLASGPGDNAQRGYDVDQGNRQSGGGQSGQSEQSGQGRQGSPDTPDGSDMGTGGSLQR
jgi:hypothetical protein